MRDAARDDSGRKSRDAVKGCLENMRNDVWLHGGAGRGPKMDVVENKSEDETLTETHVKQKHTHFVQDKAARAVTSCKGPVCTQHGCEYDVVGTAMTSTEVGDE